MAKNNDSLKFMRALSIRQPFASQIMSGEKPAEYRSYPTQVRGRIMIYATKGRAQVGKLPRGLIIGTAELYDCVLLPSGNYAWKLRKVKQAKTPQPPERQPQPAWFYPFHNRTRVVV